MFQELLTRNRYLFASFTGFVAVFGLFGLCPFGLGVFCHQDTTTPYYYIGGSAPDKKEVPNSLTFLQWNICYLPYDLAENYGGVASSLERVEPVARFIDDINADLVVLQEAHDLQAIEELAKRLQDSYAHIYYNIGHVNPTPSEALEEEAPFLNSGLMVLSKYPLADVTFKTFTYPARQWQINKGFFDFFVQVQGKDLIYAVATHLQPYLDLKDEVIREKELMEIVNKIERTYVHRKDSFPYVVMGDLNIPWGTLEYQNSSITKYFRDYYTQGFSSVTIDNRTATDFLTDFRNSSVNQELQQALENGDEQTRISNNIYATILDYFLVFKDGKRYHVTTEALDTFSASSSSSDEEILSSLSDHKALLSTITLD